MPKHAKYMWIQKGILPWHHYYAIMLFPTGRIHALPLPGEHWELSDDIPLDIAIVTVLVNLTEGVLSKRLDQSSWRLH